MGGREPLNYEEFEGIPFQNYRPFELDSDRSETVVCLSDLHAYGRDSSNAEYAAKAVNSLASFYSSDVAISLGDFGSTKSLVQFQELLDEDIHHQCIAGDEDEKPQGFMSSLEIPDFENLSVYEEGLRGEICGWNVKATHEPDICPYSPRSKLILDSIDVNPDFDDKELKAEIRKPDYDLHLYGHSHLAFCRPDIFAVYNSPGSVSKMKNTNPDKDFPDRTLQVLNFEPDTLEVLTLDAEAMSVQEHRKYNRLDDNIIQEERIIGEFGVERVHADMRSRALDRYGEFSEDITLEEALKVRKKQFRKSNGISFQ